MNSNQENKIKRDDKKAFKGFVIVLVVSAIVGGILGFSAAYLNDTLGESIPNLLMNIFGVITPFANIVLCVLGLIAYKIVYTNSRKEYELWKEIDEDKQDDYDTVDKIEEKLSYVLVFTSISTILGFFFFGIGIMLLPFDSINSDISNMGNIKIALLLIGFILNIASVIFIQKKIINFEKEMNPLLKGSVYDVKFTEKWLDSCDEGIKLEIYKSAYKAYTSVSTTCIILWMFCVLGYDIWNFGIMPMVMVIIIWLVQTVSYSMESIKISKSK